MWCVGLVVLRELPPSRGEGELLRLELAFDSDWFAQLAAGAAYDRDGVAVDVVEVIPVTSAAIAAQYLR